VRFISLWFVVGLQFPAETYLLSFCAYSVLLVLYSADVRAEESLNSLPSAIRGRYVSPYWDTAFLFDTTQNFAMLPNAIFSTWQGTQNPDTMPTLPRAKNANTQPTHPG